MPWHYAGPDRRGKLAEGFARAEHGEEVFTAITRSVANLDLAARDDEQAVALIAFAEHDGASVEILLSHRVKDSLLAVVIERGKKRC